MYTPGPDISSERYGLSCNYISSTNEIIIVGGARTPVNDSCNWYYFNDVEILSLDSGTIRSGEIFKERKKNWHTNNHIEKSIKS